MMRLQEARNAGTIWRLEHPIDDLTGKSYDLAIVTSANELNFDFPYHGPQRAVLYVRKGHPEWGTDVFFTINGQFACYQDCVVKVVFDGGSVQTFSVNEADDNSSGVLFIDNDSRFITQLRKSKEVRIAATVYQEGNATMVFNVDDFPINAEKKISKAATAAKKPHPYTSYASCVRNGNSVEKCAGYFPDQYGSSKKKRCRISY